MADLPQYSAEEVDAAIEALSDPDRYAHAQEVVTHGAPGLQKVLNEALQQGGWFGEAHEAQVKRAASPEDLEQRLLEVRTLVAEEVRVGMLVGVTVGFELARELAARREQTTDEES